nr:MAG TPA: Colicin D [Caudoviricetes sp.]
MGNIMKEKLLKMMKDLIDGNYNCNDFSYDFPNEMLELEDENLLLLLDEMPEICADYDPYKEDEEDLLNDEELKTRVEEVYNKILNM